jgi:hypothetical protein
MLDDMTPRQLAEWIAFRNLEPDPTERICFILKLGFAALCNAWGGKVEPDDFEPKRAETKPEPAMSPNQAAMAFGMWAGRQ